MTLKFEFWFGLSVDVHERKMKTWLGHENTLLNLDWVVMLMALHEK